MNLLIASSTQKKCCIVCRVCRARARHLPSETEADVCVSNVFNIQMNFQRDTKLIYEQIWELHKPHTHTHTSHWMTEHWMLSECARRQTMYVARDKIQNKFPLYFLARCLLDFSTKIRNTIMNLIIIFIISRTSNIRVSLDCLSVRACFARKTRVFGFCHLRRARGHTGLTMVQTK